MSEFINTIDVLGDDAVTDSIINRSITEFKDNRMSLIGKGAFYACEALTTVDLPLATSIEESAFNGCMALTSANLPLATSVGKSAFVNCRALEAMNLPLATSIGSSAFSGCYQLTTVDLPLITKIEDSTFSNCYTLKAVILRNQTMVSIRNYMIFYNCHHISGTKHNQYNPNGDKDGYFYVPANLVDSYIANTYWSSYASQFRALEDYTVDGTITGALDPNKI